MSQDPRQETQDVEGNEPVLLENRFQVALNKVNQDESLAWAICLSELVADAWEAGYRAPEAVLEARGQAWDVAGMSETENDLREWERTHRVGGIEPV